jgi:hypothetical protein
MAITFDRLVTIQSKLEWGFKLNEEDQSDWDEYQRNRRPSAFVYSETKLMEYSSICRSTATAWEKFRAGYMPDAIHEEIAEPLPPKTGQMRKFIIWAAASGLLVLAGTYIYNNRSVKDNKVQTTQNITKTDILPGSSKAILTLANGEKVTLDSTDNAGSTMQGNTTINFKQGQLVYETLTSQRGSLQLYNSVETPKGGNYKIILPDGTKVWLNAASSIRFPVAFTGDERQVEIKGEVYFEVDHQGTPFDVDVNKLKVRAFGTTFNIKAYDDEKAIETTLLEGKVTIIRKNKPAITLKEKQQVRITENADSTFIPADLESVVGWKNGKLYWEDIKLRALFPEIERWYNAKVIVQDKKIEDMNISFSPISRNVPVSTVFNYLQEAKHITYDIEGRNIIVKINKK